MSIDTSREAVERDVLALGNLAHHLKRFDSASGDAALMLRVAATMRRLRHERDEARADAARFLADANRYAAERLVRDLEIEGLAALFEQGNNADRAAVQTWQAQEPGRDLWWPDHKRLVAWMIEQPGVLAILRGEAVAVPVEATTK